MSARLLDGKGVAKAIREEVKRGVSELVARGVTPGLAAILVGENPASEIYVRNKTRASEEAGIHSETLRLAADTTPGVLAETIDALNRREDIDAILLQLPLPSHLDPGEFIPRIDPDKDVDGFHPVNVGRLVQNDPGPRPCTPAGIIELLRREKIEIKGARASVIGRSNIVGKPMALLLLHEHATVTICHSRTRELAKVASEGDILVAAMGSPGFVRGDFIKPGATVIDVGINRVEERDAVIDYFGEDESRLAQLETKGYTLVGDVHPREAQKVAGALTPVPGGVGPLTIAMLLDNTMRLARRRRLSS
ncbi:MAG TPA: bifunctional methylenetetrahydrofolate dehydrogenase/methenyltetrahydrofolate cyclohydrolase FolD [Vicinamibacteria bacterium]